MITTVDTVITAQEAGITDAHNHLWIAPVTGAPRGAPVLCDLHAISAELEDYRHAGGGTIVDCQPGGCGRDGRMLRKLSRTTGVQIVACTGVHMPKYYPPDHWVLNATPDQLVGYFIFELTEGVEETIDEPDPIRAGLIKIACGEVLTPATCGIIWSATMASRQTGAAVLVHTERGCAAEEIASLFFRYGLNSDLLVLCHIDKRPDIGLHRELASQGVMLEYDTFYRPKYQPERYVWPLLERMVADGFDRQIALGTDMADSSMWSRLGGGPGLAGFLTQLVPRLQALDLQPATIKRLVGENIAARLSRSISEPVPQSRSAAHTRATK